MSAPFPSRPIGHEETGSSPLFYQTGRRRERIDRAEGIHAWDVNGKRYIDGSSGAMVSNIGHANPRVIEAVTEQVRRAHFAYRLHFENDPAERLARDLVRRMPPGLDRVFFVSGGSEATESCLKLARQYAVMTGQAGRYKVISRFPSYHGSTLGALSVTGYTTLSAPFAPMMREMPKIPAPTCYRCPFGLQPAGCAVRCADELEAAIRREGPETVLAFIMEPVGGASTGAIVAPDPYYGRIREICDRYGVLLIFDEVMSGAGRTGRFLAAEHWGIVPDLVALSKGFGAGYVPLGAMIAPGRMVDAVMVGEGFMHGHTYAGSPLACAAGLAVLRELDEGALTDNAARMGDRLLARLDDLQSSFPVIGDVRGKGLLTAFELVADRRTKEPLPAALNAYERIVDIAYDRGLIIYSRRTLGGLDGDHVLVCPPLIVTADQIDEIAAILQDVLQDFSTEFAAHIRSV